MWLQKNPAFLKNGTERIEKSAVQQVLKYLIIICAFYNSMVCLI